MFENIAFGSEPNIVDFTKSDKTIDILQQRYDLKSSYISCNYPEAIRNFMSGSASVPVKNQYGIVYYVWNKSIPTDDATTREIATYEDCMLDKVNQVKELLSAGELSQITNPQQLTHEIRLFKEYLVVRLQVERGLTTPEASEVVYGKIFGGFESYRNITDKLSEAATTLQSKDVAIASLLMSQVSTELRTAHLEFYNWIAPTYGGRLSQGDQMFVRDFFTKNVPENWSIDNFLRVGHILLALKVPKEVMYKFFSSMAVGWSWYLKTGLFEDPRAKKFMDDYERSLNPSPNITVDNLAYVDQLKVLSELKKEDPKTFESMNINKKVTQDILKLENGELPSAVNTIKTTTAQTTNQKGSNGILFLGLGLLAVFMLNKK